MLPQYRHALQLTPLFSSYPVNNNRRLVGDGHQRHKVSQSHPHSHLFNHTFFQLSRAKLQTIYRQIFVDTQRFVRYHPYHQKAKPIMVSNDYQDDRQGLQVDDKSGVINSPPWVPGDPLPYGDGISMFTAPSDSSVGHSIKAENCDFHPANQTIIKTSDCLNTEDVSSESLAQSIAPESNVGFLQRHIDASQFTNYTTDDLATLKYDFNDSNCSKVSSNSPASSINSIGPFTPGGRSTSVACPGSKANGSFATCHPHRTGSCDSTANDKMITNYTNFDGSYLHEGLPSKSAVLSSDSPREIWMFGLPPSSGLGISFEIGNTETMANVDHRLSTTSKFRPSTSNSDAGQMFIHPSATVHRQDTNDQVVDERKHSCLSSTSSAITAVAADEDYYDEDAEQDDEDDEDGKTKEENRIARQQRDARLLELRRQGHTYRMIKVIGGFHEAESTLRGRVRNLTKDKSERVRKPEWTACDIALLHRAVKLHGAVISGTFRSGEPKSKIPWRDISFWMREKGASYPFAPATCSKKWEECKHA